MPSETVLKPDRFVWATTRTRFMVVTWDDVSPGDYVYHQVVFPDSGYEPDTRGPYKVADPVARTLLVPCSGGSRPVPLTSDKVRLLVPAPVPPPEPPA